jgi:hypothetical protein
MASPRILTVSRNIPGKTRLLLAVVAGGRCEFAGCNDFLFEHHLTLHGGVFGQDAHIVAFAEGGPRAGEASGTEDVHNVNNLMLLCTRCHKLVDDRPDEFPVDVLDGYKRAHETRIRLVTGLGPDLRTEIVQLKGNVGGQPVGIPAAQVWTAVNPRYPADARGHVVDLTALQAEDATFYASAEKIIRRRVDAIFAPAVQTQVARHLSVFALAPIPALVLFGAILGNKVPVDLYQRHRDTEDWMWKREGTPVSYSFTKLHDGPPGSSCNLVLSLSGKVVEDTLPQDAQRGSLYEMTLEGTQPCPTFLRLREDLERFTVEYRRALAVLRAEHPHLRELNVFPAVPAPVAVAMGRELLPKVDPVLLVHDFDKVNGFQLRTKVNVYDPE